MQFMNCTPGSRIEIKYKYTTALLTEGVERHTSQNLLYAKTKPGHIVRFGRT